ncbi:MAG: LysM peptidoglycan-binding domain-containing protein [Caldilineaceae bacterium]|nr:LysM peptidoglycan-binding domain-containing protein [Caldilineaceae bacterium]
MRQTYLPFAVFALAVLLFAGALLLAAGSGVSAQTATPTPSATSTATVSVAYTYTVQPGDSWTSVARNTGVSIVQLQAANPQAVRQSGWLIVGEQLVVPVPQPRGTPAGAAATGTATATAGPLVYTVQPGESWNSIAQKFGVSPNLLRAANPRSIRPGLVLFRGEQLIIPTVAGTEATEPTLAPAGPAPTATEVATAPATLAPAEEATEEPTAAPTEEPTEEATAAPTEEPAEEATPEPTPEPVEEATEAATPEPVEEAATEPAEATPEAIEEPGPYCPEALAAYPAQLAEMAKAPDGTDAVLAFLSECEALDENNVRQADWTGDGVDDLAVVVVNPQSDAAMPETDLLLFTSTGDGFAMSYRARAAGKVTILATDDINDDGQPDVVWVDTTCGASTCFDAVSVRSWDGTAWRNWTERTVTMAYAEVSLDDVRPEGQGKEIILEGGVYGSVGAGPQRSRTEVWSSVEGAPYALQDTTYERTNCLYFKVLDAGEALERFAEIGLVQAREMYNEAVTNRNLVKCWQHENELEELRSFSLFRLAVINAYAGSPEEAAESIAQLQDAYPDSIYTAMGETWLDAYERSGNDVATACAAVTRFAQSNPATYESLSDYGYGNPTITAEELCPILDIEVPGAAEATEVAPAPAVQAGETITPLATLTATADVGAVVAPVPGQEGELPDCPTTLDGYANALPDLIQVAGGDPLVIETWLRLCDGMADDRGGMLIEDLNGDGIGDALFLPTIVSDLGFGPGGAQGAVLLFHGTGDGSYTLVYAPDVYGQPTLLAAGDLNGDGAIDLSWTIEGCSTFCVKEVQAVTWDPDGEEYVSIIEPGATIAEGTARVQDLPDDAPGLGKALVLEGGISGTPEGGLEVPHTEIWQSVGGQPFRRLSWTYDREEDGNDCLGLRLVEADVALQAADAIGYGSAIELYGDSLNPALRACSIFGVPATEELKLLQGLATFRLIQAQALNGDVAAARADLTALEQGQPDSPYARAAAQWLDSLEESGDSGAACQAVQSIFDKETLTWQITDHFGYNHPALAPEQICFVPR